MSHESERRSAAAGGCTACAPNRASAGMAAARDEPCSERLQTEAGCRPQHEPSTASYDAGTAASETAGPPSSRQSSAGGQASDADPAPAALPFLAVRGCRSRCARVQRAAHLAFPAARRRPPPRLASPPLLLVQRRLAPHPHLLYHSLATAGSVSRAVPCPVYLQRPLRRPVAELPARAQPRAAHFTLRRLQRDHLLRL